MSEEISRKRDKMWWLGNAVEAICATCTRTFFTRDPVVFTGGETLGFCPQCEQRTELAKNRRIYNLEVPDLRTDQLHRRWNDASLAQNGR